MNILQEKCFTRAWLEQQQAELRRVDPGLLEKSILALELLGHLVRREIPFVFKGGTCMLLLLEEFRRLSIDVDIVCSLSGDELGPILQAIGEESRFEKFELDIRSPDRLPRRSHYKFSYTSVVNGKAYDILLDVMEEECLYPQTMNKAIATSFAIPEIQLDVRVPTIECLVADKLTAFAPKTVGVLYSPESTMKILKHCSDVGVLFEQCHNMEELFAAYEAIWTVENSYREEDFTRDQVLDDTIEAARLIGLIGLKGCPENEEVSFLEQGIKQLDSHIVGKPFLREEAKVGAAKAAWLATVLQKGNATVPFPRYTVEELRVLAEASPLETDNPLIRLKRSVPEAYYYWAKAAQI